MLLPNRLKLFVFALFSIFLQAQDLKTIRYSIPSARGNILAFSETHNKYFALATTHEVNYFTINFDDKLQSENKVEVLAHAQEALGWINHMRKQYNPFRRELGLPDLTPEVLSEHTVWEYYYARRWLPMRVSSVLLEQEIEFLKDKAWPLSVSLMSRYVRAYPASQMAQHLIGRFSPASGSDWIREGAIEESQFLYPKQKAGMIEVEENGVKKNRATGTGLESSLSELLDSGTPAVYEKTFTVQDGQLTTVIKTIREEVPGASVVLTLDYDLQSIAEELVHDTYIKKIGNKEYAIQSTANNLPKSIIMIDLKDMSIAAMASSPSFDLQRMSPGFGDDKYETFLKSQKKSDGEALNPFDSRAFELSFPPASTFKLVTALAGLETGTIDRYTRFPCTPSTFIGNRHFKNHVNEREEMGLSSDPLYNFSQAIKRSCNTWFYQMALEMNKDSTKMQRFFDIAKALGLGMAPELPIPGLGKGFMYSDINAIPDENGTTRSLLYPGEVANMAIGQGPLLATPLQIAWMSARLARPESDRKLKIIKEIFSDLNQAPQSYEDYLAAQGESLHIEPLNQSVQGYNVSLIKNAMYSVVNGNYGTASRVNNGLSYGDSGPAVAAKTGTGQWGENKNVAWLTGFFPFHAPRYAFTIFIEGVRGLELSGGGNAAPLLNAFLSDPVVMRKLQEHVRNTQVFVPLMADIEATPQTLRATPIFEEPQETSPYMREVDPQEYPERKRKKPFWKRKREDNF